MIVGDCMEKTIKNYVVSLVLVLISFILMIAFNIVNFFDGNFINIIYFLFSIVLCFLLGMCILMSREVIEKSAKLASYVCPVILIFTFLLGFVPSPFMTFRIVCWVILIGSIDVLIRTRKILNEYE